LICAMNKDISKEKGAVWDPATAGPPTKPMVAKMPELRLPRRFPPPHEVLDKVVPQPVKLDAPSIGMGKAW